MAASTWSTGLEPRAVRMSLYILAAFTLAAALALLAASGATFGPMDGDIPWPATAAEQSQFDAARALQWTGFGLVVATSLLIGLAVRVGRVTWAVLSIFVFGLAGLGIFFVAFAATGGLPS